MHPHILIVLCGHDLALRVQRILHRMGDGELVSELQRWSRRVLEAAIGCKCESQVALAERLGEPAVPLPFNERQRSECGIQYQDCPLGPTEPDGHELRAANLDSAASSGPLTLTGCFASLRPSYQRREEKSMYSAVLWKKLFCEDYRRLVIQNHFHKCTKSCFKKFLGWFWRYVFKVFFDLFFIRFISRILVYNKFSF